MSELKTLKDIEEYSQDPHISLCDRDELRQEAIKWVKAYEYEMERPNLSERSKSNLRGRIWILKHLNNLTSEDLG